LPARGAAFRQRGIPAARHSGGAAFRRHRPFTEVRVGVAPAIISVVCLPKLRRADASRHLPDG